MKSPARLGDRAPSTSTPSTAVDSTPAGESCPESGGESCEGLVLIGETLGHATDIAVRSDSLEVMSHADPDLEPVRRERPPGTIRIGQIAGIDVLITSTWFIVAALIAVVVAPAVERVEPGLGGWKYVAGAAFAVVLYLSVLLHEAAHALAALHYGHPVSSITLHFLGGVTAIEGESRRPREEFWIAVVGPLASIGIGAAAFGLAFVTPGGLIGMTVEGLIGANLVIGILNLVPGLPLDGGRVLKSAVWAIGGNPHRGTMVAAWGGRVAAVLVLFWPFLSARMYGGDPQVFDFVLAVVVARVPLDRCQRRDVVGQPAAPTCPASWRATSPVVP